MECTITLSPARANLISSSASGILALGAVDEHPVQGKALELALLILIQRTNPPVPNWLANHELPQNSIATIICQVEVQEFQGEMSRYKKSDPTLTPPERVSLRQVAVYPISTWTLSFPLRRLHWLSKIHLRCEHMLASGTAHEAALRGANCSVGCDRP